MGLVFNVIFLFLCFFLGSGFWIERWGGSLLVWDVFKVVVFIELVNGCDGVIFGVVGF